MNGEVRLLDDWPGARCNAGFCAITLRRGGRAWQVLMSRSTEMVEERELAAACERADVVVSSRYLPYSCQPRWLKADRGSLERSGGLTIDLADQRIESVAAGEGEHGWWNPTIRPPRRKPGPEASGSGDADAAQATASPKPAQ